MTHRGHLAILLAAALLLTATAAVAQGPPPRLEIRRGDEVVVTRTEPPGAVRVLFVGNSLTYFNELPWLFQQVVASRRPEPPVVTRFSGGSGRSLRRHWELGEVARLLRTSRWDFVVLQEQSHRPLGEPDEHARYLALFLAEARHHAVRATREPSPASWGCARSGGRTSAGGRRSRGRWRRSRCR